MSEYQYYEFLAVDRPLTPKQIEAVRQFSTRAQISATRFVNEYHWGDFRGDPDDFLSRYFDLMVYYANWGTHRLLIGLPAEAVDAKTLHKYQNELTLDIRTKASRVLLDFSSDNEESGDWEEDGGWMASLAPIREEILAGDLRSLYLAWLAGAALDEDFDGDAPPIPAGLNKLTPAQKTLAEFLRVDEDFLTAAARNSPSLAPSSTDLRQWIAALPQGEKDQILFSLASGDDPYVINQLMRQYRAQTARPDESASLSFDALRNAAEEIRIAREAVERQHAEMKRQQREAKAAAERKEHLKKLASRQEQAWAQVEQIVNLKQAKEYDAAISILRDLREIAVQNSALPAFLTRLSAIQQEHSRKYTFIDRLEKARLLDS